MGMGSLTEQNVYYGNFLSGEEDVHFAVCPLYLILHANWDATY